METQPGRSIKVQYFYVFMTAIFVLKVVLMGFFSSDYQVKMFMPFVACYLNGETNPYSYYYNHGLIPSFPYPPLMLWIECLGSSLMLFFDQAPLFAKNILFKLPSLLMDVIGLYYLIKLCGGKRKYVAVLYFASPIILYAIYMHGQLDIIPTALLMGAIYHLTQNRSFDRYCFVLLISAAILTKLHILAVIPLLFLYVHKKHDLKTAVVLLAVPLFIVTMVTLPFWSTGFLRTVLLNSEQSVLTQIFFSFNTIKLYIPVLAVILIYLSAFQINNINKDLLISLCGVLFTVFLALIPPMPGWYVWVVPFIMIFFTGIKINKYKIMSLYVLLNVFYLVYFIFFHKTKFVDLYFLNQSLQSFKIGSEVFANMLFTIISALLISITWCMYQFGVLSNSVYKRRNLPFTVGISGDSGCGKSQLQRILENLLGVRDILSIEGDGDHRWERGHELWENITALNPKANYLYRQARDIEILRTGASVKRVEYDHDTGKFTPHQKILPKKYIVLSGLHSFYLPQMRSLLDLKIYLDTDEQLRRYWKIQRDTSKRGYTKEKVISQIVQRIPDAEKYIYPQKKYADLIITYFDKKLVDPMVDNYNISLSLKLLFSTSIDIEPILSGLARHGVKFEQEFASDLRYQAVSFEGSDIGEVPYGNISKCNIPHVDELINGEISWRPGIDGLIQLFVLLIISHKMRGDTSDASRNF